MVQSSKRTWAVLLLGMALGAGGVSAYVRLVPSSAAQTTPRKPENVLAAAPAANDGKADAKAPSGRKPNIVFILTDNLGYGEPGCYGGGILRGAPTPRIDRLAAEGLRLLNFNVENQCTPSRSATHDRALPHPLRNHARAADRRQALRPDAMGNHHCQASLQPGLRHRASSANGTWAIAKDVIPPTRASTNGTESPTRPTCRCTPLRRSSTRKSRPSGTSWKGARAKNPATWKSTT